MGRAEDRGAAAYSREYLRVAAFENVSIFISNLPACGVEVGKARRCVYRRIETLERRQRAKDARIRQKAGGRDMNARECPRIRELDDEIVAVAQDGLDIQRRDVANLEFAIRREQPVSNRLSGGDANDDGVFLAAERQRIVARREALDHEG